MDGRGKQIEGARGETAPHFPSGGPPCAALLSLPLLLLPCLPPLRCSLPPPPRLFIPPPFPSPSQRLCLAHLYYCCRCRWVPGAFLSAAETENSTEERESAGGEKEAS